MQTEQDWQDRVQAAWSALNARLSSMLAQYRSGSGSSTPWSTLLIGAIIGLILGLFIGWVVWPVEWQGARVSHLDADAKAQYVAAVADAYVAAGGTDTAREVAIRRLSGLDPTEAIMNAQRYFIANNRAVSGVELSEAERMLVEDDSYDQRRAGDANIRLSNLNQLATGFGLESYLAAGLPADQNTTGAVGAPGGDIQPIETATVPAQADNATTTDDAEPGISLISILLGGLAALLLVGGGLWVLYRLSQQRNEQEENGATPAATSQRSASYDRSDDDFQQVPLGGGYEADDTDRYRNPSSRQVRGRSDEIGGFSFASQEAVEPFAPEHVGEGAREWSSTRACSRKDAPVQRAYGSTARNETFQDEAQPRANADPDDWDEDDWNEEPGAYAASNAQPTDATLDEFTAQYDASMQPSYEERRNLVVSTPDGNEVSLGEYGLGVNIKNGVRAEAPQDVIALDLWLFDKSDTRNLKNRTLVFLSDYASENGMADSIRGERSDDPEPVVPQPGDRYQLHGVDLTLDCQVLDVEYITDGDGQGAFANFEAHLTVFQPAG